MVRLYEETDYDQIASWFKLRDMNVPRRTFLPPVGYIKPDVAAGFLVSCDNNMGILDFYITNPTSPKEERSASLTEITLSLIGHAKFLKLEALKADTQVEVVKELCFKHDFKYVGEYSTYVREI